MKKIAIFILAAACCLSLFSCIALPGGDGSDGGIHTVSFYTDGGTAVSPREIGTLDKAPKTTKEAHVFCGWFLDRELKTPVVYPMRVEKDITLYAKWMGNTDRIVLEDVAVKFDVNNDYSYKKEYVIAPQGWDMQALADQGYSVKVDVTYDVYYVKDYEMAFDLGYMGAPDHDVGIVDNYDKGEVREDLATSEESRSETVSAVVSAADIKENSLRLKLLTHNTQNIVYFKNIVVNYTCLEI